MSARYREMAFTHASVFNEVSVSSRASLGLLESTDVFIVQDTIRYMLEQSMKVADGKTRGMHSPTVVGLKNNEILFPAGFFQPPITISNNFDNDISPPWDFHYTDMMWPGVKAEYQSRTSCS